MILHYTYIHCFPPCVICFRLDSSLLLSKLASLHVHIVGPLQLSTVKQCASVSSANVRMFMSVLVTVVALPSLVLSVELVCHQVETCTNSPVSCECREALFILLWTVNNLTLHEMPYKPSDAVGEVRVSNGYTSILYDVTTSNGIIRLASQLNFTLTNHLQVGCTDNAGSNVISIQRTSKF